MIEVYLLEHDDHVFADDWVRPLVMVSGYDGLTVETRSYLSGRPENNVRWVRVRDVFGKHVFGLTVAELHKKFKDFGVQYEFMRGEIPDSHKFKWRSMSLTGC